VSAGENEHSDSNRDEAFSGIQPDELVFAPSRFSPRPDVRTRVAPMASTGGLDFEPEVEGQKQALSALLAPAAAPQSGLAFEPEEGGARDRLSSRRTKVAASPGEEDIASLLQLAAGTDAGTDTVTDAGKHADGPPASPPPVESGAAAESFADTAAILPPRDAAAGQTAFRGRSSVAGDIEAELFGPGSARVAARAAPAPRADVALSAPVLSDDVASGIPATPGDEPPAAPNVASVFLSEQVLGKRRRRKTTGFLRRSGQLRAVADRWVGRMHRSARRSLRAVDRVTGMMRLPLVNIFWAAAIAGLSLLFGLALPFAGGILAACMILTIAGQPARNLIGIAGIMILSASLAEVVRQRERFLEIFLDLFG
jgi:hypothetical protein